MSSNFKLTKEQKIWFFERLEENPKGKVIVPSYCYKKFKEIAGDETVPNHIIQAWLVHNIYNNKHLSY